MSLAMAATFALGVALSIRLIAALYGFLDLWYRIRTAWPRVLGTLLLWTSVTAAAAWAMPAGPRRALCWGLAGYALFYVSLFPLRDLALRRR
jgi:hypothetical protein